MGKPDFYVLGVMRGGTSTMYRLLSMHRDIIPPHHKEINFFSGDKYKQGLGWYESLFNCMRVRELTFDGSPFYFDHAKIAAPRIKQFTPKAKFIILLRNPTVRAWSEYCMLHETDKRITLNQHSKTINRGFYDFHLATWLQYFPSSSFMIIKSEAFFKDPVQIYDKITTKFLKLPLCAVKKVPYWDPLSWRKDRFGYPPIPPDIRGNLKRVYEPHVKNLEHMLGLKMGWKL